MYYLHGGAGAPNFGDELIAKLWLDFVKARLNPQIVFSGYRKNVLNNWFSTAYPNVHFTDALSKYQIKCDENFWEAFLEGYNFFSIDGHDPERISGAEVEILKSATVFHLHGGGYINTLWPRHGFYLGIGSALKRVNGCKLIATGLGITPIPVPPPEMEEMAREALEAFDLFEVRDKKSYDFAVSRVSDASRIVRGSDDAFLAKVRLKGKGNTLHLSLHMNEQGSNTVNLLSPDFLSKFDHHKFWICHYNDEKQYEVVRGRFPFIEKVTAKQLVFKPLPLGEGDFLVTTRFHPHLMAARAGAVGQYVPVGSYSTNKHSSVLSLGSKFSPITDPLGSGQSSSTMMDKDAARVKSKILRWKRAVL